MTHISSVRLGFLEYEQVGMSFDLLGAVSNLGATTLMDLLVDKFL